MNAAPDATMLGSMSQTAFTPGTWCVSVESEFQGSALQPVRYSVCSPHVSDLPIAELPLEGWDREEVEANARLLAAAPLMFAALQAALDGDNRPYVSSAPSAVRTFTDVTGGE